MADRFQLLTLGRLELTWDGAPVLVRRRKELALLAFLCRRTPRSVDRAVAASLLWGDRDERKARVSLRQAIFDLRAVIGEGLAADATTLRLDPAAIGMDAVELEADVAQGRFEAAVERWQGPFLDGLEDLGDDRWTSWLEGERGRIVAAVTGAIDALAAEAESRGDRPAMRRWAERRLEIIPDDESDVRQLAASSLSPVEAPERPIGRPGVRGLVSPDLVGRDLLRAEVRAAWAEAGAGAGRVVVIDGAAGLGKSRLLEQLGRDLDTGIGQGLVASTRVFPSQRDRAGSALRPLVASLAPRAKGFLAMPPELLAVAAAAVPELAERFPSLPAVEAPAARRAEAIRRLLTEAAAEQPLALLVDDAPDADPESLVVFAGLLRAPVPGLLLILAGRPDGWAASPLAVDLGRAGSAVRRIGLAPLSEAETNAMLGSMAPFDATAQAALAARLHRETGGIPGVIQSVVTQLAESGLAGPDADGRWVLARELGPLPVGADLRALVREHTALLPDPSRQLLDLAAVLGPQFEASLLERSSRLEPAAYQQALGGLVIGRHLRESGSRPGWLEFPSEAVRRVIYYQLAPSSRARLHQRAARAITPGSGPEAAAEWRRHRAAGGASRRPWALVAGAGVLVAALAAVIALRPSTARQAPGTPLLLADFENLTGDSLFSGSLGAAARVGLQESRHVWIVPRNQVDEALRRMGRRDTGVAIRGDLAREIAIRENVPLVLEMSLGGGGTGYLLTARLVDAKSGRDLESFAARPRSADQVLDGVAGLLVKARRALGEARSQIAAGDSLPRVTTGSLAALQQFALGGIAWDRRDREVAARYWQRAVELDSTFALAHARLGQYHLQIRNDRPAALASLERAGRFLDRLTERERLAVVETRAIIEENYDAALDASRMLAQRYPTPASWSSYGTTLLRAGYCLPAITMFRRAIALRRRDVGTWINLATCYQAVDSAPEAVNAYHEAARIDSLALYSENINQEYGSVLVRLGQIAAAESVFRKMVALGGDARGLRSLGYLAMYRGRYREAIGLFDQSAARYRGFGNPLSVLRNQLLAAQAALGLAEVGQARTRLDEVPALARGINLQTPYYARIGAVHLQLGDLEGARRWQSSLQQAMLAGNSADSVDLKLLLARIGNAMGRPREALAALAATPRRNQRGFAEFHAVRGDAYRLLGRPDSALAEWQTARTEWTWGFEVQEEWNRLPLEMAEASLALGDTAGARAGFNSVIDLRREGDSAGVLVRRAREWLTRLEPRRE
ncbi:MAG: AAA family ATPase [Gemmatimonadales bacterium]